MLCKAHAPVRMQPLINVSCWSNKAMTSSQCCCIALHLYNSAHKPLYQPVVTPCPNHCGGTTHAWTVLSSPTWWGRASLTEHSCRAFPYNQRAELLTKNLNHRAVRAEGTRQASAPVSSISLHALSRPQCVQTPASPPAEATFSKLV